jgi:hypothetical protein
MATYTFTVAHGIVLADATGSEVADIDLVGPLRHDLNFVAGRTMVKITQAGALEQDPASGQVRKTTDSVMRVWAVQGVIDDRDIEQQQGKVRISDAKFRIEKSDTTFIPKIGDRFENDDGRKEIVAVDTMTLNTTFVLWCRG